MSTKPNLTCIACQKPVTFQALACIHCGQQFPTRGVLGAVVTLVGGLALALSPFLSWLNPAQGDAVRLTAEEPLAYLLALGGLAALIVPGQVLLRQLRFNNWGPLMAGVGGGLLTLFLHRQIAETIEKLGGEMGLGLYVAAAGSALLVCGTIGMAVSARRFR